MLLSPRSLSYAYHALDSLLLRSAEALRLTLITDTEEDKAKLTNELSSLPVGRHSLNIVSQGDVDALEPRFHAFPAILALRRGNPCWRKITDPLLLSGNDEEMIVLDPDLFFPNRFTFEETPSKGVLLMWQKPNCQLPYEVVRELLSKDVALSHHVDIGVAQLRFSTVDLAWLNSVVEGIDLKKHRGWMHIEAILWSAMLSRFGGGHLDPESWACWRRTQFKRVMIKLGVSELRMMARENLQKVKCFHGGGGAKHWIAPARAAGLLDINSDQTRPVSIVRAQPFSMRDLNREASFKLLLKRLGYYAVFSGS